MTLEGILVPIVMFDVFETVNNLIREYVIEDGDLVEET
jgi:hypothetical protein